jgi:hypothetical protein
MLLARPPQAGEDQLQARTAGGSLHTVPWLWAQPEADLAKATGDQILVEGLDLDLNIDTVLGRQPWHRRGPYVAHPDHRRPDGTTDPFGKKAEVAGPVALIGHHGKTACELIREGTQVSLDLTS